MYLHLIDDAPQMNQFIERTNLLFPQKHQFFVLTSSGISKNILQKNNVTTICATKTKCKEVAQKLADYQGVFVHNLCYTKSKIVLQAASNVLFIWGVWGFDYYYVYRKLYSKIFLPKTKVVNALLLKFYLTANALWDILHPIGRVLGLPSPNLVRQQAARRMEYTINNMVHYSEVFKVVNIPKQNRFSGIYYSIESITKKFQPNNSQLGDNIFIGNSAANSGNHIDLFFQLRKLPTGTRKIVVPLSYGCPRYRFATRIIGQKLFGNKFKPLLEFLPINEYNKIVSECSIMIFNHKRLQAVGNILFGIWAGHKVFLRTCNPVYSYLKDLGVYVFSIEDELDIRHLTHLSPKQREENRRLIFNEFSEKQIQNNYLEILSTLDSKK